MSLFFTLFLLNWLFCVIITTKGVNSTVIGVCNCSIGIYQVLCGSLLQPTADQLFTNFDLLQEVVLSANYRPYVFSMSSCSFDVISGTPFKQFPYLEKIQISENNITQITSSVLSNLTKLELLNLQDNLLDRIEDDAFEGLGNLKIVDLSDNQLSHLPQNLFRSNPLLEKVALKNNQLKEVHSNLFQGTEKLTELDLSHNSIGRLPETFFDKMRNLIALNLAQNQLSTFPKSLSKLSLLEHLDLSGNRLSEIPGRMFSKLQMVRVIDFSNNQLESLPDDVFDGLSEVDVIILSKNKLTTFPTQALRPFKLINKLDLSNNSITYLPPFSLSDIQLDTVVLSYNEIDNIDSFAFKQIATHSSMSLDLSHNKIEYVTVLMFEDLASLMNNFRIDLTSNEIRCNCAMERFYEWVTHMDDSKGFSSIQCRHPIGLRDIYLTKIQSKDSLICAAPEIVPSTHEVWVAEGNTAFLPCYNTAEPVAEVTWFFQGQPIVYNKMVVLSKYGHLSIHSVSKANVGLYTCRATNPRGQSSSSMILQVSDCELLPHKLFIGSLILCLVSASLFIICVVLWVTYINKRRNNIKENNTSTNDNRLTGNQYEKLELKQKPESNSENHVTSPVLPKEADFRMPQFLVNGHSTRV